MRSYTLGNRPNEQHPTPREVEESNSIVTEKGKMEKKYETDQRVDTKDEISIFKLLSETDNIHKPSMVSEIMT